MYIQGHTWVEWNTLNARPAKKSRLDNNPATGRSWKPVVPILKEYSIDKIMRYIYDQFWWINILKDNNKDVMSKVFTF